MTSRKPTGAIIAQTRQAWLASEDELDEDLQTIQRDGETYFPSVLIVLEVGCSMFYRLGVYETIDGPPWVETGASDLERSALLEFRQRAMAEKPVLP